MADTNDVVKGTAADAERLPKPRGKPFAKGQSGNPGGRPREIGSLNQLARTYTVEALTCIVNTMRETESDDVRIKAASMLLDRGYGKPVQAVTGEDGNAITVVINKIVEGG